MTQLTLMIADQSEQGIVSRLWPIDQATADAISGQLGEPSSDMLLGREQAEKMHEQAHEAGVVFLDNPPPTDQQPPPLTLELRLTWDPQQGDGQVVLTIKNKVLGHTVATLYYSRQRALELAEAIREGVVAIENYGNQQRDTP